jgi:hypothetical protein
LYFQIELFLSIFSTAQGKGGETKMALPNNFARRNAPEYCPKHPGCPLEASGLLLVCPKGCFIVEHPFKIGVWITSKERKKILKKTQKRKNAQNAR